MFGSRLFYKTDFKRRWDPDRVEASIADANTVSSETRGDKHMPVLDLDIPAVLIPSSTPGHSHLYLDVHVGWRNYVKVLDALADAGILQRGYVDASKERKATFVRLPWVKKQPGEDSSS